MPFTFAHPVAVIPFTRSKSELFVPSALIVGAMAPDFEYFLRLRLMTRWSHTLTGAFTFCLPVGLIVLWIYHNVQKEVLFSLLPDTLRDYLFKKYHTFDFLPLKRFLYICFSLVIGALTHILWDSFTHPGAFFINRWAILSMPVVSIKGKVIQLYTLLQDSGTFAGLLLLGIQMRRGIRKARGANIEVDRSLSGIKVLPLMYFVGISALLAIVITLCVNTHLSFASVRDILRHSALVSIPSAYIASILIAAKAHLTDRRVVDI